MRLQNRGEEECQRTKANTKIHDKCKQNFTSYKKFTLFFSHLFNPAGASLHFGASTLQYARTHARACSTHAHACTRFARLRIERAARQSGVRFAHVFTRASRVTCGAGPAPTAPESGICVRRKTVLSPIWFFTWCGERQREDGNSLRRARFARIYRIAWWRYGRPRLRLRPTELHQGRATKHSATKNPGRKGRDYYYSKASIKLPTKKTTSNNSKSIKAHLQKTLKKLSNFSIPQRYYFLLRNTRAEPRRVIGSKEPAKFLRTVSQKENFVSCGSPSLP